MHATGEAASGISMPSSRKRELGTDDGRNVHHLPASAPPSTCRTSPVMKVVDVDLIATDKSPI